jgi:hypothetical protein
MVNEIHEPAAGGDPSKLEIGQHAARALAWRTSGSFWPPIKELAGLSLKFRARLQTRLDLGGGDDAIRSAQDKLLKRLQFLKWEYESFATDHPQAAPESVDALFEFFFSRSGFRMGQNLDAHLLDTSLADRVVAPPIAAMLLQVLAENCGPVVDVLNLQSGRYLRWKDQLFDLFDQGRCLSRDERLELAQDSLATSPAANPTSAANSTPTESASAATPAPLRESPADLKELSALTPDRAYILMLTRLRQLATKLSPSVIECELMLLDELIRYAPSQIALLAERGVLRSRLQQWQGALDDLNRFFAFHRREDSPTSLVELYEQLRRELAKGSSS